jgi:hypothetical protein
MQTRKLKYFPRAEIHSRSTSWEFFTDDWKGQHPKKNPPKRALEDETHMGAERGLRA